MKKILNNVAAICIPPISQRKKLSVEECNKIILEKVPLEDRLKSVYHPMIAMDCSLYILRDCLAQIRTLGYQKTKKVYRELLECDKLYSSDTYRAMQPKLYNEFTEKTKELYKLWSQDFFLFQLQYFQIIRNLGVEITKQEALVIALAYLAKRINQYVITLDRKFSELLSSYIGMGIVYQTSDNSYSLKIIEAVDRLLEVFNVPTDITNAQVELSIKIFDTKLREVVVWEK